MIINRITSRICCLATDALSQKCRTPASSGYIKPYTKSLYSLDQVRFAGHAKWQNIANTKFATDQAKAKMISRYVLQVRRSITANGMQTDPKLNSKLAAVLTEASKMNVPKATLERAIERAKNIRVYPCTIEIQGPGGCAMVCRCESDNVGLLRREVKKIAKKFDSNLMPDDSISTMFKSRGFIRTTVKTKDGRDIDGDFAEEAAIMANAEHVEYESYDDIKDEELSKAWVFHTDATAMNPCRGELEKLGFKIISSDLELVPYRTIDFGKDVHDKVVELSRLLRESDQVLDVFHNVTPPPMEDEAQEQ